MCVCKCLRLFVQASLNFLIINQPTTEQYPSQTNFQSCPPFTAAPHTPLLKQMLQMNNNINVSCLLVPPAATTYHHHQVSWIRRKDYHLLTVGKNTYSSDERFTVAHTKNSEVSKKVFCFFFLFCVEFIFILLSFTEKY